MRPPPDGRPAADRSRRSTHATVPGFAVSVVRYAPELELDRHAHDRAVLTTVLGGSISERYRSSGCTCGPGTTFVKPAGEPHSNRISAHGASCLVVELDQRGGDPTATITRRFQDSGGSPQIHAQQLRRELEAPDGLSPIVVEGLCLELLGLVLRAARARERASRTGDWLRRVREAVLDDPARRWALDELAGIASVHRVTLARGFRAHVGMTVGEYLRQRRVERAQAMLALSEKGIAEIAQDTGFADQSHLTRVFRRVTGTTPAAYRRARGLGSASS